MIKNSTQGVLLQNLFKLMAAHRRAFGQERVYWRAVGMVLGEIFNIGRHPVTQGLMARCKTLVVQFRAFWTRSPDNRLKKESFLIALSNSINASARIKAKWALRYPFRFLLPLLVFRQVPKSRGISCEVGE
jgi:hypothetical protein